MPFLSLEQLKSRVFDTEEDCVKELKANGFKPATAAYRVSLAESGKWYIEELDPDASQEREEPVRLNISTGKRRSAVSRIKDGAAKKKPAERTEAAAKPMPVQKKAAAKKAAPAKKQGTGSKGKSSDPSPDEMPSGFDDWLFEQASRKEGVLRTEVNAKFGTERRWMPYLTGLGERRGGLKASMKREGRFTRFFLTK